MRVETRRRAVLTVAVMMVLVGIVAALFVRSGTQGGAVSLPAASVTDEELARAASRRVFFAHQSVGANILDGWAELYRERGVPAPPMWEHRPAAAANGGFMVHAHVGENGDPQGKLRDYERRLRAGLGDQVDVAVVKLCYIDFTATTDVEALFRTYRDLIAGLERDYPKVVFVTTTAPLTTDQSLKSRAKSMLRGPSQFDRGENVVRERYNALIRKEYGGSGRLYDLAAGESTRPDGSRSGGTHKGARFYALDPAYASDAGHLNERGAQREAAALVKVLAGARRG